MVVGISWPVNIYLYKPTSYRGLFMSRIGRHPIIARVQELGPNALEFGSISHIMSALHIMV